MAEHNVDIDEALLAGQRCIIRGGGTYVGYVGQIVSWEDTAHGRRIRVIHPFTKVITWYDSRNLEVLPLVEDILINNHLKGHASLADMVVTHVHVWRRLLDEKVEGIGWSGNEADKEYYLHELVALDDIEAACTTR